MQGMVIDTIASSAWPGLSAYSTSKWAVRGLTQASGAFAFSGIGHGFIDMLTSGAIRYSALELAPYGIRVNAYAPGFIDTKMGAWY